MKTFMDDRFLLGSDTAVTLYEQFAKPMPIIDYHCHLDPQAIYENKPFNNLTEVWLYGDHYKWRAMRANGIEEQYVTGGEGVSDYDRFLAYAKTVPMTIGNPLYHWSHLELRRLFGIDELINEKNAPIIWEKANARLSGGGFTPQDLIRGSNVRVVCTTDDPADSLEYHRKLMEENRHGFQVRPSFRPDKALELARATFRPWLKRLEEICGYEVSNYDLLLKALEERIEAFHQTGCLLSDHAIDTVMFAEATREQAAAIYAKALRGESVTAEEEAQYKTHTLLFLAREYSKRGWTMQLHIHANRSNNTVMFEKVGPDTGFDSINAGPLAGPLVKLLDGMEMDGGLPRTILYSLNAGDNDVLASIIGSFQGGGIPGKIQLGSAWWFNDTIDGMLAQMKSLANMGLLSRFVGMLTDSRSFLSYPRHEYFRRILCNLIGDWVENGLVPADMELLQTIVEGICYRNAEAYFRFGSESAQIDRPTAAGV
ncbi:glucuronate isomerase [Cohnella lubricantis]|uniref:Uronate isomerase n=1 Tax=Cohnella lubricantis TaxID=2163172 RepID=A0A841TCG1_9BACL|nr:glucuronate isomerase [Cohnella lubricantis]MBB6678994.1 glucuronate isomerase [Cohnella lubricantis]MBP2119519.1 glucuronate isomerase [Cohnella lubricantis]